MAPPATCDLRPGKPGDLRPATREPVTCDPRTCDPQTWNTICQPSDIARFVRRLLPTCSGDRVFSGGLTFGSHVHGSHVHGSHVHGSHVHGSHVCRSHVCGSHDQGSQPNFTLRDTLRPCPYIPMTLAPTRRRSRAAPTLAPAPPPRQMARPRSTSPPAEARDSNHATLVCSMHEVLIDSGLKHA